MISFMSNISVIITLLIYWKNHQSECPNFANMACKYLSMPASSASVERIYSIAGKIFSPDHCHLSDAHF